MREHARSWNDLSHHPAGPRRASAVGSARDSARRRLSSSWERGALGLALAALALTGCNNIRGLTGPTPVTWPVALAAAQSQAVSRRFDLADSVLTDYTSRHPRDSETVEANYWRALFRMDPANPHTSIPGALASLNTYLGDPRPRAHIVEATSMRRLIGELDSLSQVAALSSNNAQAVRDATATRDPRMQPGEVRVDPTKAAEPTTTSDAEVRKLREDLAKANAELERIRKRLAQPPPKPPR